MIITEEHKNILQIFKILADTKSELGDKIEISLAEGKLTFKQLSHYANMLYTESIDSVENFKLVYPIDSFFSLVKTVKNKDINVSGSGIKIGGGAYQLDASTVKVPDIEETIKFLQDDIRKKIVIDDFEGLGICKGFLGGSFDDLETVALMNNHWVSSDRVACSLIQSTNQIEENFYLPKAIVNLIGNLKPEKLEVNLHNGFWSFTVMGIHFIIPEKKYGLPDFFDTNYLEAYNHPDFAEINTEEMIRILKLMQIVVSQNPNNRIFLKFNKDSLIIQNRDKNQSEDSISAEVNSAIVGREVCISCSYLLNLLSVVDSDKARLFICKDADDSLRNRTMRIENTDSKIKLISVFTV